MTGRQDFFFVPALLLSILTPLFLPSSVSLFYFILAVHLRQCLGKHSRMSSMFPIAILDHIVLYTIDFRTIVTNMLKVTSQKILLIILYLDIFHWAN